MYPALLLGHFGDSLNSVLVVVWGERTGVAHLSTCND